MLQQEVNGGHNQVKKMPCVCAVIKNKIRLGFRNTKSGKDYHFTEDGWFDACRDMNDYVIRLDINDKQHAIDGLKGKSLYGVGQASFLPPKVQIFLNNHPLILEEVLKMKKLVMWPPEIDEVKFMGQIQRIVKVRAFCVGLLQCVLYIFFFAVQQEVFFTEADYNSVKRRRRVIGAQA